MLIEFSIIFLFISLSVILQEIESKSKHLLYRQLQSRSDESIISQSNYCYVSSLFDTTIDGIHSYPIDIFDYSNSSGSLPYYYCNSTEITAITHKCLAKSTICPIDKIDLYNSMKKSLRYDYKHSLCSLKTAFHYPDSVSNVIVLGGSVTRGAASEGCCCNIDIDDRCFNFKILPNFEDNDYCIHDTKLCRWSGFIERWFRKASLGKTNFFNFAEGGADSPYMAEMFGVLLKDNKIDLLTENDVVFIDHSVNDALTYYKKSIHSLLSHGLETLIRRIYHFSTPGSWPTIILLEQWPYVDNDRYRTSNPDLEVNSTKGLYDYSRVYYNIAKLYSIPLWSYRDIVWSMNALSKFSSFNLDYLKFVNNIDHGSQHPPWFIHLFYSDMIAALITNEMLLCSTNISHRWSSNEMNTSKLVAVHEDELLQCDDWSLPLLDVSAKANTTFHYTIGNYSSSPIYQWNIVEDRKGKFGWISELTSNFINDNHDKLLPTFYVSNLTFTFDIKDNAMMKSPHIIKIHYLRTYKNAGIIDVYLCGLYLTTLDALWKDYKHYHISVSQIFTVVFDPTNPESVLYCNSKTVGNLEFRHMFINSVTTDDARNLQKVKLINVKICPSMIK